MSKDYPDRIEAEKAREMKKEFVSGLGAVVDSHSDSEYSRSVPTIKIATIIENTEIFSSLVDSGATADIERHVSIPQSAP
jgi:hypothetical protein